MLDALTKGALVDCFKRFPLFAQAVLTLLPGLVKKAMDDVKKNEAITNAWVIEYVNNAHVGSTGHLTAT